MGIHKPKPVRSWRELLTEVGVIVLSVCIALAAEQTVEWWHWRNQVVEARGQIASELANNLVGAITRIRTGGCIERRLDELAQITDQASGKGSLPPLGYISMPPRSGWPTGAWDSVVASQTSTHFTRRQLTELAVTYKLVQRLEYYSALEIDAWDQLLTMTGPGRHLDPASESELRKALSSARTLNRLFASLSIQLAGRVKALHMPFSRDDLDRLVAATTRPPVAGAGTAICQPIGPPTAFYGQGAKFNTLLPNGVRADFDAAGMEQAVKTIPDFSEGAR